MQTRERDIYILESLRQAAPMVQNMALHSLKDYDELYQVAAVGALKAHSQAQKVRNLRSYVHRAIRFEVMTYLGANHITKRAQQFTDHYQVVSLDAPSHADSDQPLSDVLADIRAFQQTKSRDYSLLYAALWALPFIYRQVICMRFGLCGYGVTRQCDIARSLGISPQTVQSRFRAAKTMLRECPELLELVGY